MRHSWLQRLLFSVLALAPLAGLASAPITKDEPKTWFYFRALPDKDDKHRDKEVLYLRPNNDHEIEIYVKNPEEESLQNATVKLLDSRGRVLALAAAVRCPARGETKIKFAKGPEKAPEKGKESEKDKAPDKGKEPKGEPLTGPVQDLQLVLEVNGKVWAKEKLFVKIQHPHNYIQALGHFDRAKKRLSVNAAMKEVAIPGPQECVVQLELDPLFTAGLKPTDKRDLQRKLSTPGKYEELFAADLEFDSVSDLAKDARIFLTVDGFKRAFEFQTAFNDTGYLLSASYAQDVAVRFKTPRYAAPAPKFALELYLDGPIDRPMAVEVGLDRSGMRRFDDKRELSGVRQVSMWIEPSDKGGLHCKTDVRDWKVEFDTPDLASTIELQIHLNGKGFFVSADAMKPLHWLELDRFQPWSPLTFDKTNVWAKVELNDKLPAGVRFEPKLPENWPADKSLTVRATYEKRDVAPIKEVIFFYGDVAKDGKIPADAVKKEGKRDPKQKDVWLADLPPPGKVGLHRVSVAFHTLTDKQAVAGADVTFQTPAPPAQQLASIKGTVVHVTIAMPDITVKLLDAKGKQVDSVTTDAQGAFVFANVPPGDYFVTSQNSTPFLVGRAEVTVKGNKDVENVRVQMQSK